jgi:DNA polymerase-3 subunit alpha
MVAYAQSIAAERAASQVSLFGSSEASRPRLPKIAATSGPARLDEELAAIGFYLSGHPLQDMLDVFKRKRVTLYAEALALAAEGSEAFRMAGVVRRRQERSSQRTGEKFAFVSLSDPSGEYEVLFPPEQLRKCRDVLEPGKAISLRVRAKAGDGEVRFFGDEAEPIEKTLENVVASLRVYLSPRSTEIDALKKRLEACAGKGRGGEVVLVAGIEDGQEIEMRLPGRFDLSPAVRGALKTAPGVMYLEDV